MLTVTFSSIEMARAVHDALEGLQGIKHIREGRQAITAALAAKLGALTEHELARVGGGIHVESNF